MLKVKVNANFSNMCIFDLWPWCCNLDWQGYLCNLSACINFSFLKVGIVTHYYIRLWSVASLSMLDLWPRWCDLDWKGHLCNLSACINSSFLKMDIVTPHYCLRLYNIIFKHPWPSLTLVLCPWHWKKLCPCQFPTCIKTSFLKMDMVNQYPHKVV